MIWINVRNYLKLGRTHSAVLTGLAPVCTALATGENLSIYHYLELFFIGFLFHLCLFVLNEIKDIDIDKTSQNLSGKPLVDGSIKIKNAKIVVVLSIVIVLLFTPVFFLKQSLILIPISLIAFLLGGIYDTYGKRIPHADYFIAAMLFFIALYGAYSVSYNIGPFPYIIASLAFLQMLINNIIAGLKDVDHDFIAGGKSTPIRLDVKVDGEQFIVSKKFITYISTLKIIHTFFIFVPFYIGLVPLINWILITIVILVSLSAFFMIRFLTIKTFDREKIMRYIGFHEMFAFMGIPFLLFPFIGLILTLFLVILPVLWLGVFLIVIYGKLMPEI